MKISFLAPLTLGGLLALSFLLAGIVHWAMWGYWDERPSFVDKLTGADEILGLSMVEFDDDGLARARPERDELLAREARSCQQLESNLCLEGRVLTGLERHVGHAAHLPEVDRSLVEELSRVIRYPRQQPKTGLVVHYRVGMSRYLLLVYRTGEVSNDRYLFAEELFQLPTGGGITKLEQIQYYWEFAGLEGVTWRLIWMPIFAIFVGGWALFWVAKVRSRAL